LNISYDIAAAVAMAVVFLCGHSYYFFTFLVVRKALAQSLLMN